MLDPFRDELEPPERWRWARGVVLAWLAFVALAWVLVLLEEYGSW